MEPDSVIMIRGGRIKVKTQIMAPKVFDDELFTFPLFLGLQSERCPVVWLTSV